MPSPTVVTPHPTVMPDCLPAVTAAAHSFQGFGAGTAAAGWNISARAICTTVRNSAPHRIRESELDARVQQYTEELRSQWTAEQADLRRLHRLWEMKRPVIQAHIAELYDEIQRVEQEIDDLLLEKIQSGG